MAKRAPLSQAEFTRRLNIINPDITVLSEYERAKIKVSLRCKLCGNEWEATPDNLLRRAAGCPECMRKKLSLMHFKSHSEFVREVAEVNPTIEVMSQYKSIFETVHLRCKKCGTEYDARATSVRQGKTSCPHCKMSLGEIRIEEWLLGSNVPFVPQKRFDGLHGINCKQYRQGLSYDFYLPECNLLIEYQGEQHYKAIGHFGGEEHFRAQQIHDAMKREYADVHGIKLLEISYTEREKIPDILSKSVKMVS